MLRIALAHATPRIAALRGLTGREEEACIAAAESGQPARDALTVFDENAAFLSTPDALWDALQAKDWDALFGSLRPLWAQSQLRLFGHALLEKLCSPRKAMTAHVYRVRPADATCASFDSAVAETLSASLLESKPFAHLPVLGVPGWCSANEAPDFYRDASVFRPRKPQSPYVITP